MNNEQCGQEYDGATINAIKMKFIKNTKIKVIGRKRYGEKGHIQL